MSHLLFRKAQIIDVKNMLEIENDVFIDPWHEKAFTDELSIPFSNTYILESDSSEIIGYIIFWLQKSTCHILNLAVSQGFQKSGFGVNLLENFFTILNERQIRGPVTIRLEVIF